MFKNSFLVSVITPTYNSSKFIADTIESVLKQTYSNWEMIIVDDCSQDNSVEIIKKYSNKDNRIKLIELKKNAGAAEARNIALARAKGCFIAFLDSDDLWSKNKLSVQLKFMETNNYNFTCTDYEQIDENGYLLNKIIKSKKKTDYNGVLLNCPVGNSTVIYNAKKLGVFKVPNIRKRNDDALWLQILKKEKYIYGMPNVLMRYRIKTNSISSNKLSLIIYHWILYRKIEHLSIFRSVFHICYWGYLKIFKIK